MLLCIAFALLRGGPLHKKVITIETFLLCFVEDLFVVDTHFIITIHFVVIMVFCFCCLLA